MPCLTFKNRTKSNDTVTCKGSVDQWPSLKIETEAFLKRSVLTVVHNTESFNNTIYNDDSMVKKNAVAWSHKIDATKPSWVHALVEETDIEDETELFNWGFGSVRHFHQFEIGETLMSG